jgi:predicted protein tyrosine phosphatase
MSDFEIFKDILNDPTDINPDRYLPSSIYINEETANIISNLRFEYNQANMRNQIYYCEYIKNLERMHAEQIKKFKNYLHTSFVICEKIKRKYQSENVLRNEHQNK